MKKRKTILLIEDNKSLRVLMNHLLSKWYRVISRTNGLDAMGWLAKGNTPDLILLDLEMPEMTGKDFLEGLQSSGFYKDIPVIIISGNKQCTSTADQAINVQKYFEKPFDPELLRETIEYIFDDNSTTPTRLNGMTHPM